MPILLQRNQHQTLRGQRLLVSTGNIRILSLDSYVGILEIICENASVFFLVNKNVILTVGSTASEAVTSEQTTKSTFATDTTTGNGFTFSF